MSMKAVVNTAVTLVTMMPAVPSGIAVGIDAMIPVNTRSTEHGKMHVQELPPVEGEVELEPVPPLIAGPGLPTSEKSTICQ
jgi:hypothetical protein